MSTTGFDRFSKFENAIYRFLAYFIIFVAPFIAVFLGDMFLLREISPFIRYPLWAVLWIAGLVMGVAIAGAVEDMFRDLRKTFGMKPLRTIELEAEESAAALVEPDNIRAFNWLTLKVLNDLYDAFPQPTDIEGLHFIISTLFDIGAKSQEAKYLQHFSATVRWLRDEGFIKYEADNGGNFRGVVLTLRGLTVLGYVPSSLNSTDKQEPMIAKIKRVLAKGAEGAATDVVKAILVKLFALAVAGVAG